jgi:hypothetical protein
LAFLLVVLGGGPVRAQRAALAPPAGAVTIPAGEEQATVVADQMQQVGGATDLMIAIGNVEITRGQTRRTASRSTATPGRQWRRGRWSSTTGPTAWWATASTTT